MGKPLDTYETFKSRIEAAGFINVQEVVYKSPVGTWPKHPVYKEAGKLNQEQLVKGVEGYLMHLFTNYGHWDVERVNALVEECKREFSNNQVHKFYYSRRVWAQKPPNSHMSDAAW